MAVAKWIKCLAGELTDPSLIPGQGEFFSPKFLLKRKLTKWSRRTTNQVIPYGRRQKQQPSSGHSSDNYQRILNECFLTLDLKSRWEPGKGSLPGPEAGFLEIVIAPDKTAAFLDKSFVDGYTGPVWDLADSAVELADAKKPFSRSGYSISLNLRSLSTLEGPKFCLGAFTLCGFVVIMGYWRK